MALNTALSTVAGLYQYLYNNVYGESLAATAAKQDTAQATLTALLTELTGRVTTWGVAGVPFSSADQSAAAAAVSDAPAAGLKLVLSELVVMAGATAQIFTFTEETSGTVILKVACAANSTVHLKFRGKIKLATTVKKLMVQSSAAGAISVLAGYSTEA